MGLLGKAIAKHNLNLPANAVSAAPAVPADIESVIADYHRKIPVFHCIVLRGNHQNVSGKIDCHGAVYVDLPGEKSLVLLPGALDRELFAHRISHNIGSTVLAQFCVNSPSLAIETIGPCLR